MIHRLYPIINIQAVVCTNTPSNHGGSPGRRIIFKLGSVVAAVPPPSRRSLPLLPGRPGPGPEGPHREKGVQPPAPAHRLQRAKPQPRPHRSPAGDGVLSAFGSCPLPPPPPPSPAPSPPSPPPGWGGGEESDNLAAAIFTPLQTCAPHAPSPAGPCLAAASPRCQERPGLPAALSSPSPARPGLLPVPPHQRQVPAPAPGAAPRSSPSARGDGAGAALGGRRGRGMDDTGHRRAASRQNGRGMQVGEVEGAARSQPALLLQRGLPSLPGFPISAARGRDRASSPSPRGRPGGLGAAPAPPSSARVPGGRPGFSAGGRPGRSVWLSACPCRLSCCPLRAANGARRAAGISALLRSKANANRRDLSFAFIRKIAALSP